MRHLSKYALVLLWACVPSVKVSYLGVGAFRQEQGASVGVGKGGSQARAEDGSGLRSERSKQVNGWQLSACVQDL